MSRLEEIKNEYAKEFDYNDWTSFINDQPSWGVEGHMNDICKRYATEVAQASLEKASEKAKMNYHDGHFKTNTPKDYVQIGSDNVQINKESITNPENIVLL